MNKKAKKISSNKISQIHTGVLVLENKMIFKGMGIGYQGTATGEVLKQTSPVDVPWYPIPVPLKIVLFSRTKMPVGI